VEEGKEEGAEDGDEAGEGPEDLEAKEELRAAHLKKASIEYQVRRVFKRKKKLVRAPLSPWDTHCFTKCVPRLRRCSGSWRAYTLS
jgi:hypothetical protein